MAPNLNLKDVLPYALVLGVSAYLYYVATQFDFTVPSGRLGPDFWPKLMLMLMMAVCAYEIIKTLFFGRREAEGLLETIEEEAATEHAEGVTEAAPEKNYTHLLLIGIGFTAAYVYLFDKLGFFLDTFLYLAIFMYLGRYRRPGVILAVSLLGSLVFMFIFMKIVYISLPVGQEPFSAVSLLLMKLMGIR